MISGLAKRHRVPFFWFVPALIVLWVPWIACSPTSEGIDDFDGGKGIDADGQVIRPGDDVVLPGGFVPAQACGNLGNICDNGKPCGKGLTCEGGVCLPDPVYHQQTSSCRLDSCPQAAPFCTFGVCLTPDELACVCLDREGRTRAYQCAAVSGAPVDACLPTWSVCDTAPDSCCEGLKCLRGTDAEGKQTLGVCMTPCSTDEQCASNCCADNKRIAEPFCGESIHTCENECKRLDEECDTGRNPCCMGLVCAKSMQDIGLNGCQLPCTKHSECKTNCCVLFTAEDGTTQDNGICAPADRCETP